MKNILLSLLVLPLLVQSMEKRPVPIASKPAAAIEEPKTPYEQKKLNFCLLKIAEMTKRFRTAKNRLQFQQSTAKPDFHQLKLSYTLTGEILSEELTTLIKINPLSVIASIKLNAHARKNLIYILHNTDPASDASHAKYHEELLCSLNQEIAPKNIKQWAVEYDKQQLEKRQPQRYGTCLDQNFAIQIPVAGCSQTLQDADVRKINARREIIGLPSIEEQIADAYQKEQMNKRRDC